MFAGGTGAVWFRDCLGPLEGSLESTSKDNSTCVFLFVWVDWSHRPALRS